MLRFNCTQVNYELVVVEYKTFFSAQRCYQVVDEVIIDWISDMLIVYYDVATLIEFGNCKNYLP